VPPWWVRLGALAVAGVLAWLSWRLLEQPLRHARKAWVSPLLLAAMLLVGPAGAWVMQADGVPQRAVARTPVVHAGDIGHAAFDRFTAAQANFCRQSPNATQPCFPANEPLGKDKPVLALLGDSHAAHLAPGLAQALPERNIIFFDAMGLPNAEQPELVAMVRRLADDARIDGVIITAAWSVRIGKRVGAEFEQSLHRLVEQLAVGGRRVVVLEDVPIFPFTPRRCQYQDLPLRPVGCEIPRERFDRERDDYRHWLVAGVAGSSAQLLSLEDTLCDSRACSMRSGELLLYRDNNHLGIHGTRHVAAYLLQRLPWLKPTP